jgi:hemoglobin
VQLVTGPQCPVPQGYHVALDRLRFALNLIDQIGQATGGPLQYKGLSMPMPMAHQGMNITNVEFNALVAELGKAMTTKGVPATRQTEAVNILAPLKSSIVGK